MIKAVLLDANKTIEDCGAIESHLPVIFSGIAEHIRDKGYSILEKDIRSLHDKFRVLHGNSAWEYHPVFWRTVVHHAWNGQFTDADVRDVYNQFLDFYIQTIRLHDDVLPTLRLLRKSYRLALVANGNADRLYRLVSMFKLNNFFDCIAISGESPFAKPDPFPFNYALSELQIHPEEAVMVGDRFTTDIAGARALGIRTIHISRKAYMSEFHGKPWLCPDADIRSIGEIPSLLENSPTSWVSTNASSYVGNEAVTDAVIVCGGKGVRMGAITSEKQKCILPLSGIPMLDYLIRSLVAVGCRRMFFLLGHYGDQVKRLVGDGRSYAINPVFLEGPYNGTLHAVASCFSEIRGPFYYLHAHVIYPTRLLEMLWSRYSATNDPQIVVVNTPKKIGHIRVQSLNDGIVTGIDITTEGGPAFGDLFLGVALYDKELFSRFAHYNGREMAELAVKKSLNDGRRIYALPYEGRWKHYETEGDYNADASCTPSVLVGW